MHVASPSQDQPAFPSAVWSEERLNSWKEIAVFFRREVRTVQMWEKKEGLPVRRQQHCKLGSVFALRHELEQWWISRSTINPRYNPTPSEASPQATVATASDAADCRRVLSLPFELVVSHSEPSTLRERVARFGERLRAELNVELRRLKLHPIALPARALPTQGTTSPSYLRRISHEFNAGFLLRGTISYTGERLRILVQLSPGCEPRCAWSDCFEDDLLSLHSPAAAHIAQAAAAHILRDTPATFEGSDSNAQLARNAYRVGLHFWNQRSRKTLYKAVTYLRDAVELDPECAGAYATLADAYVSLSYHHLMSPLLAGIKAAEVIECALRLEPESTQVLNAQINVLLNCRLNVAAAERECARLVAQGRADARTFELYSIVLGASGRHRDAVARAGDAHRIAPESHSSIIQLGQAHFYARNQQQARAFLLQAICMKPQSIMNHAMLGRIEGLLGNWKGVLEAGQKAAQLSNGCLLSQALLAYAYAGNGDHRKAASLLDAVAERRQDSCYPAYEIAVAQALLHHDEDALENLARATDLGDMKSIFIAQDPAFAGLRPMPGFRRLAAANTRVA